jgi:hypothetical protein
MKSKLSFLFCLFVFVAVIFSIDGSSNGDSNSSDWVDPREEATVSISFDGLMALCFGNPDRVSVGLLDVDHHTPEITIIKVKGESHTKMAILAGKDLRSGLFIDVEGKNRSSISRYFAESMDDPKDFRWNIDMEEDLYQRQLHIKEERLFGKIHFGTGLFYTGELSDEFIQFFAADNSGSVLPFNRRYGSPAAKINLETGDSLVIKGEKVNLRLVAEPGVKYEMKINNLPPASMANMDHWLFYYDVVGTKLTPYMPVAVQKATFGPKPLLCMPVIFSRSQLK